MVIPQRRLAEGSSSASDDGRHADPTDIKSINPTAPR